MMKCTKLNVMVFSFIFCIVGIIIESAIAEGKTPVIIEDERIIFDVSAMNWKGPRGVEVFKDDTFKTPEGEPAVFIEISADRDEGHLGAGVLPREILEKIGDKWERITFWLKPDNSALSPVLTFGSAVDSPYHAADTVKLIGNDWVKIELTDLWRGDGPRLEIKNIVSMFFQLGRIGNNSCKFFLGPIRFELQGIVNLDPLKAISIFSTESPPIIDGNLDDVCWKNMPVINDFYGNLSSPTKVMLCYNRENIYVSFYQEINTNNLVSIQKSIDGTVWADDSFQILFSPGNDNRTYHQFIFNSLNVNQSYHQYFDKVKDSFVLARNLFIGKWESAVNVEKDRWTGEMKITIDLLSSSGLEKIYGMQIYINNPSLKEGGLWNESIPFSAINPTNFGVIYLAGDYNTNADLQKELLKKVSLRFVDTIPIVNLTVVNPEKEYKVLIRISTPEGKVFDSGGVLKEKGRFEIKNFIPKSGKQRLTILLKEDNGIYEFYGCKTNEVVFSEKIPYGEDILVPSPKKWIKGTDDFIFRKELKIYTGRQSDQETHLSIAEKIREDCYGYMQVDLPVHSVKWLPEDMVVISSEPVDNISKEILKDIPGEDGYILDIKDNIIILAGKNTIGLFYSAITLSQLQRYAFIRNEKSIRTSYIEDWSSLPFRTWENWWDVQYSIYTENTPGADKPEEVLAVVYDYLNRLAIGSKLNTFVLRSPTSIKYSRPENTVFTHRAAFMTIDDLSNLAKYCRKNFVEFIPSLSGPSHANWMTEIYPELTMPGYSNWDANPLHPKFFKVWSSVADELIESTNPNFFHIGQDEWWHQSKGEITTTFEGKEKRDIFYETIMQMHQYLRNKGIRVKMYTDMLQREHNGGPPYNNYLNAEKLPRDIIMCVWFGGAPAVRYFAELGYETQFVGNKCVSIESEILKGVKNFTGIGVINYGSITPDFGYGPAGMLRTADLAWNFWEDKGLSLADWLYEKGANVLPMYSVKPNPTASSEFIPIDIEPFCNDSRLSDGVGLYIDGLADGKNKIGFIPTKIILSSNKYNVIRGEKEGVIIPIGEKASSLIFFHTEYIPPEKIDVFLSVERIHPRRSGTYHGVKTGVYNIHYEDGQIIPVYIRNSTNCGNWQPLAGRSTSAIENKYIMDVRYVWEGKEVNGKETCLYQYEWVNPRPEVLIKEIEFLSTDLEAIPYLFAITLRKPLPLIDIGGK